MWTAWNTVFIEGIPLLHGKFDTQGYKGFFKSDVPKKGFINFDGIKRCISEKSFGIDEWML